MLVMQAIAGLRTGVHILSSDEDRSEYLSESRQYRVMVAHLGLTLFMFNIFTFFTVWFIFFYQVPINWFENNYYLKDSGIQHAIADSATRLKSAYKVVNNNIHIFVTALGLIFFAISGLLFISLQLMKKLMRRVDRINSVIHIQSLTLAALTVVLFALVESNINFDGINSSTFISSEMPSNYHGRLAFLCLYMLTISYFTYFAAYFEVGFMFGVSELLIAILFGLLCVMGVTSRYSSTMMLTSIDLTSEASKCAFVMP